MSLPDPNIVTVGSTVLYMGYQATVIRMATDQDADLAYYEDGKPRFAANVRHGFNAGCWQTYAEFEAGLPRTPREQVEDALREGRRAPKVGLRVVFMEAIGKTGWCHTRPTRAVITDYESFDVVHLAILAPDPPDDPTAPDLPVRHVKGCKRYTLAEPKIEKQGFTGHWGYHNDGLIEFGPALMTDLFPPFKCHKCKAGITQHVKLFYQEPEFRHGVFMTPHVTLCVACRDELERFLGNSLPVINQTVHGVPVADNSPEALAAIGRPPAH
jgi:hypothetical protein